ncbi:MAG: LysE family translocator [Alphaproteobacteria bacterium]
MELINWNVFYSALMFSLIMHITPGLNNILSFLFTLNYGLKKALIYRLGVLVGWPLMGAGVVFLLKPIMEYGFEPYFRLFGGLLLVYIGVKILLSKPDINSDKKLKYIGFWGAVGLQIINGKAWAISIGVASAFLIPNEPLLPQATAFWWLYVVSTIPCLIWNAVPYYFKGFLSTPKRLRMLNIVLGGWLLYETLPPFYTSLIDVYNIIN